MGRLALAHIEEYIFRQRAIFAPIRRLPDDILMRIFEESAGPVTQYGTFAWTLTAVCKRWRAVGLACASLWSRIQFNGAYWGIDVISDMFETALTQSRGALLDLTYVSPRKHTELVARIHKVFAASSHLWRTASFTFDDTEENFTWFTKADMSNLESLTITVNRYSFAWDFGYTPKLKRLVLYQDLIMRQTQRSIGTDGYIWSQLTHLSLGILTNLNLYLEILQAAENLESLNVQMLSVNVGPPQSDDLVPLKLPRIRKLCVGNEDSDSINYLVLPNLTELQVCRLGQFAFTSETTYSLVTLFRRSGCNLLKVNLSTSFKESMYILRAMPSIEILNISYTSSPLRNEILEWLVIEDNPPQHSEWTCFLPNLRSLRLDGLYPTDLKPVMDVVLSRLHHIGRQGLRCALESLMFWYKPSTSEDGQEYIEELRKLRNSGRLHVAMQWIQPQHECKTHDGYSAC
ncbi:hypothetical protein M422DRAFT_258103 [Sphaerobolus stellatus SS14]|uniref:F-box domain-containing protein n=1 Tax=Sphaerobolus stellatus (strain SS14) TaxID=990650 RepID=A0A0C9U861_SPHS4|nr:hypothetical protein M422DRAFT_258103 [Sphaerobolus stellatus SS14]